MNFDSQILLAKRVDESFNEPTLNQALRIALYDELHALRTYEAVIAKFGNRAPFSNIVQAEQTHINELLVLFDRYAVEPVVDDWAVIAPNSLEEACQMGVLAEIDNMQMYDALLPYAQFSDVADVFYRLQAASVNNHLPAFYSCTSNNTDAINAQIDKFIPKQVKDLLGTPSTDLLIGLILGAAGVYMINDKKTENKNQN